MQTSENIIRLATASETVKSLCDQGRAKRRLTARSPGDNWESEGKKLPRDRRGRRRGARNTIDNPRQALASYSRSRHKNAQSPRAYSDRDGCNLHFPGREDAKSLPYLSRASRTARRRVFISFLRSIWARELFLGGRGAEAYFFFL